MVLLAPSPVRVPVPRSGGGSAPARNRRPAGPVATTAVRRPGPPAAVSSAVLLEPRAAAVGAPAWPAAGRWSGVAHWVGFGVLAAAVGMMALQLRDAPLGAAFAAVDLTMLAVALGWFALSLVAAAYTVMGFSPLPLRLSTTLLAQLAVGGLRLVVPSAAGMPAVIVRYLTRSGARMADAAATVAAGQAAQLVATAAVVAALGAGSGRGLALPGGTVALVGLAVLAVLAAAGWIAAGLSSGSGRPWRRPGAGRSTWPGTPAGTRAGSPPAWGPRPR